MVKTSTPRQIALEYLRTARAKYPTLATTSDMRFILARIELKGRIRHFETSCPEIKAIALPLYTAALTLVTR